MASSFARRAATETASSARSSTTRPRAITSLSAGQFRSPARLPCSTRTSPCRRLCRRAMDYPTPCFQRTDEPGRPISGARQARAPVTTGTRVANVVRAARPGTFISGPGDDYARALRRLRAPRRWPRTSPSAQIRVCCSSPTPTASRAFAALRRLALCSVLDRSGRSCFRVGSMRRTRPADTAIDTTVGSILRGRALLRKAASGSRSCQVVRRLRYRPTAGAAGSG